MGESGSRYRAWRGLDSRVWRIAFARTINTMGLSLVMTFLGIYIVDTRGYPAWMYGVVAMFANLAQSMSSAWAGNLSDRIGRMPLIYIGLFLRALVIAGLGTQVLLDAPLWSLALNMVFSLALRGCFEPVAYALVADVVRPEQRIAAFGLQRMSTNLGWAIGPAIGGGLTVVIPYGIVFFIAGGAMAIAGLVTVGIRDPIAHAPGSRVSRIRTATAIREGTRDPLLRLLLLGTFLCALLETQMFATFGIYLTDELHWPKSDVGWLYTINGLGVLLLQVPALGILHRYGIGRVLPWSSLLDAAGFAIIGFIHGFWGGALAIMTLTCAEVLFDPAHQAAVAECGDTRRRGRTFGVVSFMQMIGIALAPLLGGILLDTIGDHHVGMWMTITTIGLAQTLCFIAYVRARRKAREITPA